MSAGRGGRAGVRIAVIGGAVLLGLVGAELGLQAAAALSPTLAYRLSRDQARILPDERLGHRPHPLFPDHDRNGYRNREVPERPPCAVALGDSQTYGHHVRRSEAWPQVLAERTGVSTYNMAFGGWGPGQSLLLLDDALALEPRIVLLGLYTGNDLYDAYDVVYRLDQLPRLAAGDPALATRLAALEPPDWSAASAPPPAKRERHSTMRAFFARHSRLYGLARAARRSQAVRTRARTDPYTAESWDQVLAATSDRDRFLVLDRPPLRTVFTPRHRLLAVDRGDERIGEGYRIALAAVAEMARRSERRGASFLVLLIPTKELALRDFVAPGTDDSYDRLTELEQTLHADLLSSLHGSDVPVIDGLAALRRAAAAGEPPYPPSADGHPNHLGHAALAEAVASALESHLAETLESCRQHAGGGAA